MEIDLKTNDLRGLFDRICLIKANLSNLGEALSRNSENNNNKNFNSLLESFDFIRM